MTEKESSDSRRLNIYLKQKQQRYVSEEYVVDVYLKDREFNTTISVGDIIPLLRSESTNDFFLGVTLTHSINLRKETFSSLLELKGLFNKGIINAINKRYSSDEFKYKRAIISNYIKFVSEGSNEYFHSLDFVHQIEELLMRTNAIIELVELRISEEKS